MSLILPILYKKTGKGSLQQWRTWVEGATIFTEHGKHEGKLQQSEEAISEGKNAGRANATSPEQQAEAEAQSRWNKKVERQGYVQELERARAGETNAAGGISPMLAKTYQDIKPAKLRWPYRGQRKLNGVRCLVEIDEGVVTLWSRRRMILLGVPHIKEAYEKAFAHVRGHYIVDGELYRHGWSLQKISGFTRKQEPKDGYLELKHYVYDFPISLNGGMGRPWLEREKEIDELFSGPLAGFPEMVKVETVAVNSHDEAVVLINQFVHEGFEGIMLRLPDGPYEPDARSYGLLKFKLWKEEEFPILSVHEGRGKFEGLAMFHCKTVEGRDPKAPVEFDVCAPGGFEEREEHLANGANLVGKLVTVKFFEFTDGGSLEFPTGEAIRDYE